MADYRTVKTAMWAQDEWFMDLPIDAKLLWLYLFTNAHASVAGIYKLPIRTICNETGIEQERVEGLLRLFAQNGKAKHSDGMVWVVKMREHQATTSPLVEKRIAKDVASLPDTPLKREYLKKYRIDTVSIGYSELRHETDTETETNKRDEGLARPPASPPPPSQEPADPEFGAALSKFESLGMITGAALLELQSLWPDLSNGRRGWIDDAITVAHANKANSPVYAIRVLANAVKTGNQPGQTLEPVRRGGYDKDAEYKRKMEALLGD
jgi:hypothetical protein